MVLVYASMVFTISHNNSRHAAQSTAVRVRCCVAWVVQFSCFMLLLFEF